MDNMITFKSVLFITYDGLLDPLGGSQILPYLYGIAAHPRPVHILSFEKPERLVEGREALETLLEIRGITWTPLSFTRRYGVFGKVWDLVRMYYWGIHLVFTQKSKIIHARGHAPAQIGLLLKRLFGAKLNFDFRGLWVDERVDKGGWDMQRLSHRLQYRHFKRVEQTLLANADQIVVLTQAVVNEVVRLGAAAAEKTTVIPCCADFDHFSLATPSYRESVRTSIDIPNDALVLGYLGSVGGMYMPDRYLRLIELAVAGNKEVHALVITQDIVKIQEIISSGFPVALQGCIHIRSANRAEIPELISAMDVLVSFIVPTYARMGASPTKLAECFAVGIPAICNFGVGDVAEMIQNLNAGIVVNADSDEDLKAVVAQLDAICTLGGRRLREAARKQLGLEVAAARYRSVYSKLD